jgi:serine protease Do
MKIISQAKSQNNFKSVAFIVLFLVFFLKAESQTGSNILRTDPSGAGVFDANNNKLGETPFNLSQVKQDETTIKIVKPDYVPVSVSFARKKRKDELLFPASVTECSGCVLGLNPTAEEHEPEATIRLFKKFNETDTPILIGVDNPVLDIKGDIEIGRLNGSRKRLKDKDIYRLLGYPENMEMKMLNSFEDSYLYAEFFATKDYKNSMSTLQTPKVILKPIVKKIDFNLKGDLLRDYTGFCTIECDWQIVDLSDTNLVLNTYSTKTSFYRSQENYELLLHQMVALAERDLLENETLYQTLAGYQKKYLDKSKGSPIKLKLSGVQNFTNASQMINEIKKSVVTVDCNSKFGSGVFISDNGHLITNYHVIEDASEIFVKIGSEKKVKAEIVKVNKDYDLVILKADIPSSKGVFLLNERNAMVGEEVFAIGTPLEKSLGQTVTRGIVSGYREMNGVDFIQTDVSINSGNSGGPLLSAKGEIIGINTLKVSGKNISGIGFAIPSDLVIKMLYIVN